MVFSVLRRGEGDEVLRLYPLGVSATLVMIDFAVHGAYEGV